MLIHYSYMHILWTDKSVVDCFKRAGLSLWRFCFPRKWACLKLPVQACSALKIQGILCRLISRVWTPGNKRKAIDYTKKIFQGFKIMVGSSHYSLMYRRANKGLNLNSPANRSWYSIASCFLGNRGKEILEEGLWKN